MKRTTYKILMKKVNDGYAEINAWSTDGKYADVTFYTENGRRRQTVEVTNVPAEVAA